MVFFSLIWNVFYMPIFFPLQVSATPLRSVAVALVL